MASAPHDTVRTVHLCAWGLFLLNVAVKGLFLGGQPVAGDEPFSVFVAHNLNPPDIIRFLSTGNNPPLWELILHYWTQVFGTGPVSVRFLPMLFSAITVALVFRIGVRYFDLKTALLASLLVTFSDYHIHFAHEARSYALFGMLACMSMWMFMRVLVDGVGGVRQLICLSLVNAALLYTHFFGLWVLMVQFLVALFLAARSRCFPASWLLSLLVTFILYAPYIGVVISRFMISTTSGTWVETPNGLFSIVDMLRTFTNEQYGTSNFYGGKPVLTVVLLTAAVAGHIRYLLTCRERTMGYVTVVTWFVFPFLAMWVLSFRIPMFHDRYLMFVSIGYALVIAIGLRHLFAREKAANLWMVAISVLLVFTCDLNVSNKRDLRSLVDLTDELRKDDPNVPVVICPEWFDLGFLYHSDPGCFATPTTADLMQHTVNDCLRDRGVYAVNGAVQLEELGIDLSNGVIFIDADADRSHPDNGLREKFEAMLGTPSEQRVPEIFSVLHYGPSGE